MYERYYDFCKSDFPKRKMDSNSPLGDRGLDLMMNRYSS